MPRFAQEVSAGVGAQEARAGAAIDPAKTHPTFLSDEFAQVVLTGCVTTEREYLRASRAGRGTTLTRRERKYIWQIISTFLFKCALRGSFTFPAIAAIAAEILATREGFLFDHVLVDEAQDFHAGHWRFLRACVGEHTNDIFLAEDSHQRIYGSKITLSHFGIHTRGRASRRLRVNYRTTAETLGFAQAILDAVPIDTWRDLTGEPDALTGYYSVRHGPQPILVRSTSATEEIDQVMPVLQRWVDQGGLSVGVLTRSNSRRREVEAQLSARGLALNADPRSSGEPDTITVMTMHQAKGLEFTHVALLDVGDSVIPRRVQGVPEAEVEDAMQRERALLYVASTRARDELLVSVVGEPSELLPG